MHDIISQQYVIILEAKLVTAKKIAQKVRKAVRIVFTGNRRLNQAQDVIRKTILLQRPMLFQGQKRF